MPSHNKNSSPCSCPTSGAQQHHHGGDQRQRIDAIFVTDAAGMLFASHLHDRGSSTSSRSTHRLIVATFTAVL